MDTRLTVGVVDDQASARLFVRRCLESHLVDVTVVDFECPVDALAWLNAAGSADLLILDYRMPQMNGLEFLRAFRASPNADKRDVPVIFVTSYDQEALQLDALAEGAIDFVAKPIRPRIFASKVHNLLQQRRQMLELRVLLQRSRLPEIGTAIAGLEVDPVPPRALECLSLYGQGLPVSEIAETLGIREKTVYAHLQLARQRLNANNLANAIALANQRGLMDSGGPGDASSG